MNDIFLHLSTQCLIVCSIVDNIVLGNRSFDLVNTVYERKTISKYKLSIIYGYGVLFAPLYYKV